MFVFPGLELALVFLASLNGKYLNDKEISLKIKKGDHQAFKHFFDSNYTPLFRFLVSRGMDKATSDDLIQKAFLIIWEKREEIDVEKSLRAYLFRTAYTRMLNETKYNSRFEDESSIPVSFDISTPDDEVHYKQLMQVIHKTVTNMPEKRRMVFDCCFLQQLTYKEAAEVLDVSVKTIENHMGIALKEVRKAVAGIDDADYIKNITKYG